MPPPKPLADAIMKTYDQRADEAPSGELQRRILELIQDFELKTDWRVEIVNVQSRRFKVRILVKQPPA